jgi:hypothetical protein
LREDDVNAEEQFKQALAEWLTAGQKLVNAWSADGFNADEKYPLPAKIAPPMSMDEWFDELRAHYEGPRVLDLEKVCSILAEKYNVHAYVEQTGGGCATIYAGDRYPDDTGEDRYQAAAGPGWFAGPGWTRGRATTDDFCVGPDDDGQADPVFASIDWDEARVAAEIDKLIKNGVTA